MTNPLSFEFENLLPGRELDPALEAILRIAAWTGHENGDEAPVTYTALLIACLLGYEFGVQDPTLRWFQSYLSESGIKSDSIFNAQKFSDQIRDNISKNYQIGLLPEPGSQKLLSTSVETILKKAEEISEKTAPEKNVPLSIRHLLVAYAFGTPSNHQNNLDSWGFNKNHWQTQLIEFLDKEYEDQAETWKVFLGNGSQIQSTPPVEEPEAERENLKEGDNPAFSLTHTGKIAGHVTDAATGEPLSGATVEIIDGTQRGVTTMDDGSYIILMVDPGPHAITASMVGYGPVIETDVSVSEDYTSTVDFSLFGTRDVLIANYTADDPFAEVNDLLDIGREARAFARIAASKIVRPPLSIGIFGEWGSGKTFFMERMYKHVERLSEQKEVQKDNRLQDAAPDTENDSPFHKGIVQIRFNAWHYIETNLWASLVEYIFTELDRWLRANPETDNEKVKKLFDQLATSRHLKLEAVEDLIFRHEQRQDAEKRLESAQSNLEEAQNKQSEITPEAFWNAVSNTFYREDHKSRLKEASEILGMDHLAHSARHLHNTLRETAGQTGRIKILGRAIFAPSTYQEFGRPMWLFVLALGVLLVPVVLMFAKEGLAELLEAPWVHKISSAAIGLSSLLATATGLLGKMVGHISPALKTLEEFRNELESVVEQENHQRKAAEEKELARIEQKAALLKHEVKQAEHWLSEADRHVHEANHSYENATARGRLNTFIRDKVVNGDYTKHLGIIATIRKDFGQLAQLMADGEQDQNQQNDYQNQSQEYRTKMQAIFNRARENKLLPKKHLDQLKEELEQLDHPDENELKLFKRIILYIDDLDRCPPNKVVEVLQAIHLLLYFPLFVVVVAVDARWVSRSLKEVFPELLLENVITTSEDQKTDKKAIPAKVASDQNGKNTQNNPEAAPKPHQETRAASSQDYLEKIFQIPYWVRPMDAEASKKYVSGLVKNDVPAPPVSLIGSGVKKGDPPVADLSKPFAPEEKPTQYVTIPKDPADPPDTPKLGEELQSTVPAPQPTPNQETQPAPDPEDNIEESPESEADIAQSMILTKEEATFLSELAPFAGNTPWRGIRFVNVYRLVKTSLTSTLRANLTGPNGNSLAYRALITQLAIVTGAPQSAWTYFERLAATKARTLNGFITTLKRNLPNNTENAHLSSRSYVFWDNGRQIILEICPPTYLF